MLDRQRVPLDPAELTEDLGVISEANPELAAVLDHVCIRLDAIAGFIAAAEPVIAGLAAVGESIAGGGMGGIVGMMTAGPRAD